MLIAERGMKSVSVLVPPHEILLIPISVAAPSTVAPASPKALGGSMTSKGVPASRMRMRLRRAQTTDHGFNLPPSGIGHSNSIIFKLPFGKTKSLVGLDDKLIYPSRGKCYSLLLLPVTYLFWSQTLEGLFEVTLRHSSDLNVAWFVASGTTEIQGHHQVSL